MPFKAGAIFGEASLNTTKWMTGLTGMHKATVVTMGAITALMVVATAKTSKAANTYTKELTNVTTLLDEQTVATETLNKAILGIDSTLGETTELTRGMYQAFSAGAETLEEAMKITTTSAKFAKAGLTDIFTSVDVLTTAINAYGKEVVSAESASDIFFTTIKKGKITGEELAASIGISIPLYASAGIKLEELSSGLAALTKQGVKSRIATTQLNAIVNGFLKPSEAMTQNLKSLGFESGSAFLRAEGLAGALDLVSEATDGDATKIAELLPNIRALRGAMALTGVGGVTFTETLNEMETAVGATQEAFDKQEKTWATFNNSLKKAEINIGLVTKEFVDGLVVALTSVTEWFNNLGISSKEFAGNFLTVGSAVGVLTFAVFGLNAALTALAANPVVAVVVGVSLLTTGVIALAKTLNSKAIRDASPRFEEMAKSAGLGAEKVEDLAKASLSLDKFFEASAQRGTYGLLADETEAISNQVQEMSKRFEITEQQIIDVALASEKISEEQTTILENLKTELDTRDSIRASELIARDLNSVSAIMEEKALLRIWAREDAQKAINDELQAMVDIQAEIDRKAKEARLLEQTRLEGVIEARKTALQTYDKALETATIRANLGITSQIEKLEEVHKAAETYRDDLITIGFTGENASSIGNRALTETIGLLNDQKEMLEAVRLQILRTGDFYTDVNERMQDSTDDTVEENKKTWKDYFNWVNTGYSWLVSSIFGLSSQLTKNQQADLEIRNQKELQALKEQFDNKLITEEEYDAGVEELNKKNKEKLNALNKKAFEAEKANRVAGVAQSAARSIMGWWEVAPQLGPIAGPIFGTAMSALVGGFAIANASAILAENFVPALAKGGRGSGPTRVHEQGGEIINLPDGSLVIPNDISRMIAGNTSNQNVMNVSFAGAQISDNVSLNRVVNQVSRKLGRQLRTA